MSEGQAIEARCPRCGREKFDEGELALHSRVALAGARLWLRLARRLVGLRLRCARCACPFEHAQALPRTVVGYHGCRRDFGRALVAGRASMEEWKVSQNEYDWLGEGIYFWEHAPGRAWQWARERFGDEGAVVATEVRLGRCLDFADTTYTRLLGPAYDLVVRAFGALGRPLPRNGGRGLKLRNLDRLIIRALTEDMDRQGVCYQTVRGPFEEGDPLYPGGMIRSQSHVQVAVRDRRCLGCRIYWIRPEGG